MKDIKQLIKKNSQEGRYEDIFPKTFIDAVEDRESGNNLTEILSGFNMYFLSYNGSRELTRLQVPLSLRKTGLWITYVLYDKTVVTEWYAGEAIDDASWKNLSNWRVGSNMLVGDISISSDGYWVVNGVITTTKAQGEQGITPMLRVGSNNHLQVSYTNGSSWIDVSTNPVYTQFRINNNKLEQSVDLGQTWTVVSDYIASWFRFTGTTGSSQSDNVGKIQVSRDNGATWSDLSGEFTNSLHIKGYVATVPNLPSTAVQGDIYGVGPTYDPSDTEQTNPIYQLYVKDSTGWVNNGKFTSIAAGVVQTTGTSTTEVMSQDAVSKKFAQVETDLADEIAQLAGYDSYFRNVGSITSNGIIDSTRRTRLYTDLLDITNVERIKVIGTADNTSNVLSFYKDNGEYISGISGLVNDNNLITIAKENFPTDAKYIRAMSSPNGAKYLDMYNIYNAIMSQIGVAKRQSIIQTNAIINAIEAGRYIDNTESGILYVGNWAHNQDSVRDHNGGNSSSSRIGDYLEIPFFGTSVSIYHRSGASRGIVEVFVDDESKGLFDAYSGTVKYQVLLTSISGLDKGLHTLKIVITGLKNINSTGIYFIFDYIDLETSPLTLHTLKDNQIENVPYNQISNKKNANHPLRIKTYDGGNQGLHPKVLYFRDGFAGWRYWLVFSPYKNQNEAIENPCIYVSQNGVNWDVPNGLTNPIDDIQNVSIEYNSDPHLVYNNMTNEIECWWRWVGRGTHPTKPYTEIIYRRTSKDGINWSDKELSFEWNNTENSTRAVISPSIIFEDGIYKMWASHSLDVDGTIRPIGYWESTDANTWVKIRNIDLGTVRPSHLDVVKWKDKYRMIVFDVNQGGYPYYYLESIDGNIWTNPVKVLEVGNQGTWDSAALYRPSLCVVDGWMRLYYSAYSTNKTCYLGLIIFDDFNLLKIV